MVMYIGKGRDAAMTSALQAAKDSGCVRYLVQVDGKYFIHTEQPIGDHFAVMPDGRFETKTTLKGGKH